MTVEDKYKKQHDEMEALKDQLAVRKEASRRGQKYGEEWKDRMREVEQELETQADDYKDVSANMTRQYKTMHAEMEIHIIQLREELQSTQARLAEKERLLKKTQEEKEKMCREKDLEIGELKLAIDVMGTDYENVLKDSMGHLTDSISELKDAWFDKSTAIQDKNKRALLEFGLNPLSTADGRKVLTWSRPLGIKPLELETSASNRT